MLYIAHVPGTPDNDAPANDVLVKATTTSRHMGFEALKSG
jgi:hypothetical protein